jgi:hypothetical protein
MLEFGEDYFEEIGDIPKPVPVSVLKDNPNLLDVYIKSNMWSNILIEYLSGLSGFCQGREKWSLINMEKIVKRNSLFYITFNAVRNNQKT